MKKITTICLVLFIITLLNLQPQPAQAGFFSWIKSLFVKEQIQETLPASVAEPLREASIETGSKPEVPEEASVVKTECPIKEVVKDIPKIIYQNNPEQTNLINKLEEKIKILQLEIQDLQQQLTTQKECSTSLDSCVKTLAGCSQTLDLYSEKISTENSFLKIEKCKSLRDANRQKLISEYEKTWYLLKSSANATLQQLYSDCLNKSYDNMNWSQVGMSALDSIIDSIGMLCEQGIQSAKKQLEAVIVNTKGSDNAKIEAQLQQEYQGCINQ